MKKIPCCFNGFDGIKFLHLRPCKAIKIIDCVRSILQLPALPSFSTRPANVLRIVVHVVGLKSVCCNIKRSSEKIFILLIPTYSDRRVINYREPSNFHYILFPIRFRYRIVGSLSTIIRMANTSYLNILYNIQYIYILMYC